MSIIRDTTQSDNKRTLLNFHRAEIDRVLPEHIVQDYPALKTLFSKYYEWLDSADNFGGQIHELYSNRDATQVSSKLLQFLEDELLLGQAYFGGFQNKREAIKFSNQLYRSKGTKYSTQQFFRGFFGIDPVVEYPKNNIFLVGPQIDYNLDSINNSGQQIKEAASQVGPESRKYITDDKLYQVLSVLIKTSLPLNQWKDVYKLFVHPAGVYLAGETLIEMTNVAWNNVAHNSELANNGGLNFIMDEIGDSLGQLFSIESINIYQPEAFAEITLINKDDGSVGMTRQRTDQTFRDVGALSIDSLGTGYTLSELLSPNSVTLDDSDTRTFNVTDAVQFSQQNDVSGAMGISSFDQHEYSTIFDSSNIADSAHWPFPHI